MDHITTTVLFFVDCLSTHSPLFPCEILPLITTLVPGSITIATNLNERDIGWVTKSAPSILLRGIQTKFFTDGSVFRLCTFSTLGGGLNLTRLALTYNLGITDKGLSSLASAFKNHLRVLDVSGTDVGSTGMEALVLHLGGKLTSLRAADCPRLTALALKPIEKMKQLTELDLSGSVVTASGVESLLRNVRKIEKLKLCRCNRIRFDVYTTTLVTGLARVLYLALDDSLSVSPNFLKDLLNEAEKLREMENAWDHPSSQDWANDDFYASSSSSSCYISSASPTTTQVPSSRIGAVAATSSNSLSSFSSLTAPASPTAVADTSRCNSSYYYLQWRRRAIKELSVQRCPLLSAPEVAALFQLKSKEKGLGHDVSATGVVGGVNVVWVPYTYSSS